MKKIFITGLILVGLASCTKEYTCKCTSTYEDGSTNFETEDYFNIKESQAKTNCENKANEVYNSNLSAGYKSNVVWVVNVK